MRFKSANTNGYIIYAVSGTNTISFAIDFRKADTKGLLGFAVERIDHKYGERKFMDGYKVFKQLIEEPDEDTRVSTYGHPVQSFVWDDFTCYPDVDYDYLFYPLKGTPRQIDRTARPIKISAKTEKLFSNDTHDVFFNRGVASSQAYRRKFYNLPPDKIENPQLKQQALNWLSRQLDDAILRFIGQAKKGDTLLGCFYEFRYEPVVQAFKDALDRGVDVRLVVDMKKNDPKDPFPRDENLAIMKKVGIPTARNRKIVFHREAKRNDIQHNKFIVFKSKDKPVSVWTGSTNISMGGIHGQTNVGHWIRDRKTADSFAKYWELLSSDPGGKEGDDASTVREKNKAFKEKVEAIQGDLPFTSWEDIPMGITTIFSPRSGLTMLNTYVDMLDNAEDAACITLAFGINQLFKDALSDNDPGSHITFTLLEKKDAASKNGKTPFVYIGAGQNVYKAWGSYMEDPLYNWARETSTRSLGLNKHVAYIHSKFMLVDPLGHDPVVVTGSANFSDASTRDNDENMVIIRGNTRVADIYFTEFNRLFNHYYFRSVYNSVKRREPAAKTEANIFLKPNDSWTEKYKKGKFRYKRIEMYSKMGL